MPRSVAAPRPGAIPYNPALDGLRALAVLAVLGFHMEALSGGYLGVDVFFVLSGFLITSLLLAERERTGGISLAGFYVRRAFRLLPAFAVFVAAGSVLVAFADREERDNFIMNAVTAFGNINNYFRVLSIDSDSNWLGHVWSLSVEEQFYLLWPLGLILLCRHPAARRRLPLIILCLVVLVVVWREVLIAVGVSGLRIYWGLDTRADALLIGCALAAWLRHGPRVRGNGPGSRFTAGARPLALAGWTALALLVGAVVIAPDVSTRITMLDHGGYTTIALLAAVLILSLDRQPANTLGRLLGSAPLSWLGRISYGFYLWHYPVTGIVRDRAGERIGQWPSVGVAIVLSTGLAAASYYLVERPVQRHRPRWATAPATTTRRLIRAQSEAHNLGSAGRPTF
ncbi:acyltransferase [Frankia sp. CcI49]|nr:acyltransferase [Frankia sp. CcI49]